MPKLVRKTVIGIVSETTQGTAVACGATDFMLASDVKIDPDIENLPRDYYRSDLDPVASAAGKRKFKVTFKTELKGSGAAGTAYAPLGAALKACRRSQTVNAGVSVVYAPISDPPSANFFGPATSCTIEIYLDGLKHVVAGCVGNCKISFPAGRYAVLDFSFEGLYAAPTDTPAGTQTYLATSPAIVESAIFSIHAFEAIIASLELDFGNTVSERPGIGAATSVLGYMITESNPTAKFDAEVDTIANHDVLARIIAANEGVLTITLGATAGNIVTISCPKAQYTGRKYGERNGILIGQDELKLNRNTGNDHMTITMT